MLELMHFAQEMLEPERLKSVAGAELSRKGDSDGKGTR